MLAAEISLQRQTILFLFSMIYRYGHDFMGSVGLDLPFSKPESLTIYYIEFLTRPNTIFRV